MTRKQGGRAALLPNNLPALQNMIKRDAASYRDEFLQQWRHYQSLLSLFKLKPDGGTVVKEFGDLVTFLSHVVSCYPNVCREFPAELMELVKEKANRLDPELRKVLVSALILLRNKGSIDETSLLSLFFTLFRLNDKNLRQMLHSHIVTDIKNSNAKTRNNKLNKVLQGKMYEMVKDSSEIAAKKSLEVMIDLYRKNIWNDAKTVNVVAEACLSPSPKLVATALHFFLGTDRDDDKDSADENGDGPDINALKRAATVAKKTKKRQATMEKAVARVKRKQKASQKAEHFNFSALHLINDPQGFGEKLFSRLKQATQVNDLRFEVRLMLMSLISRLIGVHKLLILGFHSFLIRYLQPNQKDVTSVLAYTAQSSHELIPPEDVTPLIQAIANNFVWSNAAPEVIVAGLNGLREISARCPLAMPEELLSSLVVDFKGHREKGVGMAVRSLISLYREVNPNMLPKKQRGKAVTIQMIDGSGSVPNARYGEIRVAEGVDGADMLLDEEERKALQEGGSEVGSDGWEDVESKGEEGSDDGEGSEDGEEGKEVEGDDENGSDSGSEGEEVDLDAMLESGEWEIASLSAEEEGEEASEDEEGSDAGDAVAVEEVKEAKGDVDVAANHRPSIVSQVLMTSTALENRKRRIEEERIFTDEDFRRMKKLKTKRDAEKLLGDRAQPKKKPGKKQPGAEEENEAMDSDVSLSTATDSDEESSEGEKEFIEPHDLLKGFRKKATREDKEAAVAAGREGREKYGSKKASRREEGPKTSTTNKEKAKNKNFMMIAHTHKVKGKKRRSMQQKKSALVKHKKLQKRKGH